MCRCRNLDALLLSIALILSSSRIAASDEIQTCATTLESMQHKYWTPSSKAIEPAFAVPLQWLPCPEPAHLDSVTESRLEKGDVIVESYDSGTTKFVLARICIETKPEYVWPILANPFEFENKICSHMKSVEMLRDTPQSSIMRCNFNVCLVLPKVSYTVESKYDHHNEIQFRRLAGTFREFRGAWFIRPLDGGKSTEVLYSLFIDPGIPLPKWLIREALKAELPHTLLGLRTRVYDVYSKKAQPEMHNIAAGILHPL